MRLHLLLFKMERQILWLTPFLISSEAAAKISRDDS